MDAHGLRVALGAIGPPGVALAFVLCVALATYAQTLTGFAFGLILLSLVTAFDLASVADAANAATVLTLVNAFIYFRGQRRSPPWRLMRPALLSSILGVVAGVGLLHWLSGNAVQWLKALLGLSVVLCALALVARSTVRTTVAPARGFAVAGILSGLMGGLFGTSGPPIVYHLYRQPLAADVVRSGLLLLFSANAFLRLVLVLSSGGFSARALVLSLLSVPVVHLMTRATQRFQPPLAASTLRLAVAALLVLSGGWLVLASAHALWSR